MKIILKVVSAAALNGLLITGLLLFEFAGYDYVGNLVGFGVWFLIVVGLCALACPSKDVFKKVDREKVVAKAELTANCALVVVLAMVGWTVTAGFYSAVFFLLMGKRMAHEEALAAAQDG